MDRPIVYPGQVPRSLDNLNLGQMAMVALAKLSEATLGTGTVVAAGSFAVSPTNPASLNVAIGPGQIYELESLEATALGGTNLGIDSHQILKQGLALDGQSQTLTPPATVGYAQNVLIQVQYQDLDDGQLLLTYQNPNDKTQTFQGPGGSGDKQFTIRRGVASIGLKSGIAAPAGSQVTPAPDAGFVGLYVVTLAYGQTTITAGNIAAYVNAPFIPVTLPGVPAAVQSGKWTYGIDSGAASALVIALAPTPTQLTPGMEIIFAAAAAPTGASVANVASTGNLPLVRRSAAATAANDWAAGDMLSLRLNKNGSAWMLGGIVPSDILALIAANAPAIVQGNPTIYVRTDGSDAAGRTGAANAAASAFATPAAAIAYAVQQLSLAGKVLSIQLGIPGAYPTPGLIPAGLGAITIQGYPSYQGDPANQDSYILQGAGAAGASAVVFAQGSALTLSGLTVRNTGTTANTVGVGPGGSLSLNNVTLSAAASTANLAAIVAFPGGSVNLGSVKFATSMGWAILASGGNVTVSSATAVLSLVSFAAGQAVVGCVDGNVTFSAGSSWTGTATGTRYAVSINGVINTFGAGANFIPGSVAGTISSGGQYV